MPTWLKVVLIVVGAFMVLALAGGVALYRWANTLSEEAQASVPYPTFVGNCVTTHTGSPDVIDCAEPHDYEVYHVFAWPGTDDYPDWAASLESGWEVCQSTFEGYVGIEWVNSLYDYEVVAPPPEQWDLGERTMKCVLYDIFDDTTVGSALGTGR